VVRIQKYVTDNNCEWSLCLRFGALNNVMFLKLYALWYFLTDRGLENYTFSLLCFL
jgi:hypothetical protein